MSRLNEGLVGRREAELVGAVCSRTSYSVLMVSMAGANLGGPTITHAPAAWSVWLMPCNSTIAVTGPSATSSCHPSLLAKVVIGAPVGEDE